MSAFTGTTRLLRLALRRDRIVLSGWVVALAVLPALFALAFASDLPTQADVLRETRLMAGNAGFRMLSLSPGASIGAYAMNRGFVTLAVLAAVMSITLRGAAHAPERGDRPRRACWARPWSARRRDSPRPSSWRSAPDLVLAPLTALGLVAAGQPARGLLRRRRGRSPPSAWPSPAWRP